MLAAASLNFVLAASLAAAAFRPGRAVPAAVLLAAAAAAGPFLCPPSPPHALHCGPVLYARSYAAQAKEDGKGVDRALRDIAWDMPLSREGRSASVAVVRNPDGAAFLRVNGKTDASTGQDMGTQLLLGHLGALLHPESRRALVIGFASGVTVGALAQHPLDAGWLKSLLTGAAAITQSAGSVLVQRAVADTGGDGQSSAKTRP